ncbi:MAG: hypothetical protein QG657_4041 [Acidobacteriota bacterium]|nr:hypothetical protein [Acidobacteriota bacterium]
MPGIIDILPDLKSLWQETRGSAGIRIAVLDGPVDISHPCFNGAHLSSIEPLAPGEPGPNAATRHGASVAGIIFGQHGSPIEGIAPGCAGLILPIFRNGENGEIIPGSQLDLARAITRAVEAGAHIINISGGEFDLSGDAEHFLARAVDLCVEKGVLIVSAAGNDGCDCLHVPASLPQVLAVGAMDAQGKPMGFSNWGAAYRQNGILAPGENIPVPAPGGGIALKSGTSFATPIVTGVVGLLLSLQLEQGKKPDPYAIRDAVLNSAIPCNPLEETECQRFLVGRLNIAGAKEQITAGAAGKTTQTGETKLDDGILNTTSPPITPRELEIPEVKPQGLDKTPRSGVHKVYAVGAVGYDFRGEARRDSIKQNMEKGRDPRDVKQLLAHLKEKPGDANAITWLLNIHGVPVYAIAPFGPFAEEGYRLLLEFLEDQVNGNIERISLPGIITGRIMLMSGQEVPVVTPDIRGMYSWTTGALVEASLGAVKGDTPEAPNHNETKEGIKNFLERVYYELENKGLTSRERAINFAAINAHNVAGIFSDAVSKSLSLAGVDVEKSAICRPGSDCQDVILRFFHPHKKKERAVQMYRFTVDVSDVLPVTVGEVRSWNEY